MSIGLSVGLSYRIFTPPRHQDRQAKAIQLIYMASRRLAIYLPVCRYMIRQHARYKVQIVYEGLGTYAELAIACTSAYRLR